MLAKETGPCSIANFDDLHRMNSELKSLLEAKNVATAAVFIQNKKDELIRAYLDAPLVGDALDQKSYLP